jgi:hypothetical protein
MTTITTSGAVADWFPGDDNQFQVTITGYDLRLDTLTFRLKSNPDFTDAQAELTNIADVATYGVNGIAVFTIAGSATAALTPRRYWHDIVWERASDNKQFTFLLGRVELKDRVSDA